MTNIHSEYSHNIALICLYGSKGKVGTNRTDGCNVNGVTLLPWLLQSNQKMCSTICKYLFSTLSVNPSITAHMYASIQMCSHWFKLESWFFSEIFINSYWTSVCVLLKNELNVSVQTLITFFYDKNLRVTSLNLLYEFLCPYLNYFYHFLHQVTLYECHSQGEIRLLQSYVDADVSFGPMNTDLNICTFVSKPVATSVRLLLIGAPKTV